MSLWQYANDSSHPDMLDEAMQKNAFQHMLLVNNIFSVSRTAALTPPGQCPKNAVHIYAAEHYGSDDAALATSVRELWIMVRRREEQHFQYAKTVPKNQSDQDMYKGLELLMSGNERWCKTTGRFQ